VVDSMSFIVEVVGVRKVYGRLEALKGITLRVREGEIYGLVGPNGAGKTTLLRILTGYMPPTEGRAELMGIDIRMILKNSEKYWLPT